MGVEVPTVRNSISSPRPRAGRLGGVWASVPGGGLTRAPPPAIWIRATSASSAAVIGLDCTQTEASSHSMQEPRRREYNHGGAVHGDLFPSRPLHLGAARPTVERSAGPFGDGRPVPAVRIPAGVVDDARWRRVARRGIVGGGRPGSGPRV